jgi:hypothetical protein
MVCRAFHLSHRLLRFAALMQNSTPNRSENEHLLPLPVDGESSRHFAKKAHLP